MPLPRAVARFNKRYTNRLIEPLARRFSGFAIIVHRGRTSGRVYRTPVNVFHDGSSIIVALTYGPDADWVKNVAAGGGICEIDDTAVPITQAEIVDRDAAWHTLPLIVRGVLRVADVRDFYRLTLDRTPRAA